jgi:hypothetical protein
MQNAKQKTQKKNMFLKKSMNHKNLVFQNWGCGNYTLVMNITSLKNAKCWQKNKLKLCICLMLVQKSCH